MKCPSLFALLLFIALLAAVLIVGEPLPYTLSTDLNPWAFINSTKHLSLSVNGSAAQLAVPSSIVNFVPVLLAKYASPAASWAIKFFLWLQISCLCGGIASFAYALTYRTRVAFFVTFAFVATMPWQFDPFLIFNEPMAIFQIPQGNIIALGGVLFTLSFYLSRQSRCQLISGVFCALFQPLYGFFLAGLFYRNKRFAFLVAGTAGIMSSVVFIQYCMAKATPPLTALHAYLMQLPFVQPWEHPQFTPALAAFVVTVLPAYYFLKSLSTAHVAIKALYKSVYGLTGIFLIFHFLGVYGTLPILLQLCLPQLVLIGFLMSWVLIFCHLFNGFEYKKWLLAVTLIPFALLLFYFPYKNLLITFISAGLAFIPKRGERQPRHLLEVIALTLLLLSVFSNFWQWLKFLKSPYFEARQDIAQWIHHHVPAETVILTPDSGWQAFLPQPVIPIVAAPNLQFVHDINALAAQEQLLNFWYGIAPLPHNSSIINKNLMQMLSNLVPYNAIRLLRQEQAEYFIAPFTYYTHPAIVYKNDFFQIYAKDKE